MLINSPSNPTGQTFSAANMSIIVQFCKAKQILLISDEIYSDVAFDGLSHRNSPLKYVADDPSALPIVMTGGLSKVSGLILQMTDCLLICHRHTQQVVGAWDTPSSQSLRLEPSSWKSLWPMRPNAGPRHLLQHSMLQLKHSPPKST